MLNGLVFNTNVEGFPMFCWFLFKTSPQMSGSIGCISPLVDAFDKNNRNTSPCAILELSDRCGSTCHVPAACFQIPAMSLWLRLFGIETGGGRRLHGLDLEPGADHGQLIKGMLRWRAAFGKPQRRGLEYTIVPLPLKQHMEIGR